MGRPRELLTTSRRRLAELTLAPVATTLGFWLLDRLDLMADTPLWALVALLAGAAVLSEAVRRAAPHAIGARIAAMVVGSGAVIYATGWGPILVVGFMYPIAVPIRSFGSRATPAAFAAVGIAIAAGQVAVAADVAPTLIEERLAHGLAALGFLGLTMPTWVIHQTTLRSERSEAELAHRADHDPLTGLPNRTLFLERLGTVLERDRTGGAAVGDAQVAVLFVDLDRFKIVNDSLGHEIGDLLLVGVAERITSCVRPSDVVARLGGDEFTVLLPEVGGLEDVVMVAERVHEELQMPFVLGGYELATRASIGVVLGRPSPHEAEELLRDADVAMYHAKRRGGRRTEIFTSEMGLAALRRLELEGNLRRAIEHREFELHYQPEVDLPTGRVVGVEALVRWIDPPSEDLELSDVIGVAEETGLIVPLGRWVLEEACSDAQRWFAGLPPGQPAVVAVNISARQFQQPGLVEQVSAILGLAGLDPARARLEITESAVMHDERRGNALIHQLKELGVEIALDDFGTGHSSLGSLSRLPADVLKLDRSFVGGLDRSDMRAIVEAVVSMAHRLGLRIVAEGVETPEQLAGLVELGCDGCQGYLFSHPVPGPDAAGLVRDGAYAVDRIVASLD